MVGVLIFAAASGLKAQTISPTQPPPKIEFAPWKEVPTEEGLSEFTASFPSAVTTKYPENNIVPLRILLPAEHDQPVPVVVILHYLGATDLRVEREMALQLVERGIGAVIMTLPYHLGRTPAGYRSGQLAILPDPALLVDNMTQSVLDVRRTVDFIESRPEFDKSKVGVAGTSLGSIVSILAYAIDSRITSAAFLLGGADLANILWHSTRVAQEREALRRRGYNEAKLRAELETIEPLTYLPARAPGSTFVVGGRYDTVIPPADTEKLIQALPNVKTLWIQTGHYGGIFVQTRLVRTVATFFSEAFKGSNYAPPHRLYAPTVRIGVQLDPATSLQVGAGIDLWRSNAKGDVFSTIMATPRGPELFLGAHLGKGLAIGGFARPRRSSFGLLWSTVL